MFVNRGMIEAASTEGEVAGVMAHELAHVLLRHGTANATKAQGFQIGALAGAIAGAVIGGGWGQVISQGSQFGLGTWLMKYSREYERQADLVGAQIMARAGYDPRDLAHMFETIQKQGGNGGPEWLSSHPNPGNRTQYIAQEAAQLRVGPRPSEAGIPAGEVASRVDASRAHDGGARAQRRHGQRRRRPIGGGSVGRVGEAVPAPSRQYRTVQGGQLFTVSVPANWQPVSSNNSIKYVPQNAYGDYQRRNDVDARRRARRRARVVARSQSGDADADRQLRARQRRHAQSRDARRTSACPAATRSSRRSKAARRSAASSASTCTRRC